MLPSSVRLHPYHLQPTPSLFPSRLMAWPAGGKYARKHVPVNLRHIISAESAANDGLAYPFLTIAIYLTIDKSSSEAVIHWILIGWLCESETRCSFLFSGLEQHARLSILTCVSFRSGYHGCGCGGNSRFAVLHCFKRMHFDHVRG